MNEMSIIHTRRIETYRNQQNRKEFKLTEYKHMEKMGQKGSNRKRIEKLNQKRDMNVQIEKGYKFPNRIRKKQFGT